MTNSIVFIDRFAIATETQSLPFLANNTVQFFKTSSEVSEMVLRKAKIVCIVLYEPIDLLDVIVLYNQNFPLVIATTDRTMLAKINELDYAYALDLQQDATTIETEIVAILAHLDEQAIRVSMT